MCLSELHRIRTASQVEGKHRTDGACDPSWKRSDCIGGRVVDNWAGRLNIMCGLFDMWVDYTTSDCSLQWPSDHTPTSAHVSAGILGGTHWALGGTWWQ